MKIAMIGHKRIPSREGGVEQVVQELSRRMAAKGHRVVAYNRSGKHVSGAKTVKVKQYEGVRIKTVPTFKSSKLNAAVYSFLATAAAIFGRYDVIHYHAEGPCSMLWLPHLMGIRTVATIHGLDWQRSKWGGFAVKFLKFGERTAAKYADEIIVLSENVHKYFLEQYDRETIVLGNGVSTEEYVQPSVIKDKYGLDKNDYILFLARLVPEKGAHYLIDAFKRTKTDKKLVIAGGVSHSDEYEQIVKRAAKSDDRIVFTGFVEGRELWELYYNCCLYVLPSDVEGMPLTLLEAMGCGCECLVSDIEENKSVAGRFGTVFKSGNSEDLAEKLSVLLTQQSKDKSEQKEYIKNNHSWDAIANETLKIYEKR